VSCNLRELLNEGSTRVGILVTTTIAGSLTNNANESADTADPNQGSNAASETTTVMPVEPATNRDIFLPLLMKFSG